MRSVTKEIYGVIPDGTVVTQFTLTNASGMMMKVIEYGGIITHLTAPDKNGNFEDVVLGHDSLEEYLNSEYYLGALIGRYGNRIANASFSLHGIEYELEPNDGVNNLHGGSGFHSVLWQGEEYPSEKGPAIKLIYTSKDGECGFPGTLEVEATYTLSDQNELIIEYKATTDKSTVVNLTQHSYFNLSGMKEDILSHQLQIDADTFLAVDDHKIPSGGLSPVAGTPFDFTSMKTIGDNIASEHNQIQHASGFDHNWVLNKEGKELKLAAVLAHPESGRKMEVLTTEPGIQFYSGNFLKNEPKGKSGTENNLRYGLCLETQHYPNSPNRPDFPSTMLEPGEEYRTTTIYRFDVIS
ncbi:MAG: galactose mutarotase [Balneolaceae bacterium]|nr:galactose mutarotase [Balneolaceae bacterium]MBO6544853.1 galactose mutarotase [Balneolaceae bacterium]MBO6646249.1 galactose mutarotase [Balneolaceae bacterium]